MAQSIYFGGPILTMEEPLYAQALVEENGVIRYVGQLEQALELAGPQARKVDLEGRCLMPAFLDPHSHFMACANSLLQVQLGGVRRPGGALPAAGRVCPAGGAPAWRVGARHRL